MFTQPSCRYFDTQDSTHVDGRVFVDVKVQVQVTRFGDTDIGNYAVMIHIMAPRGAKIVMFNSGDG